MINQIRKDLWSQFGAAIDMLENAVSFYPESFWKQSPRFFYSAFHCTVLLDYYLTVPPPSDFNAELPFSVPDRSRIPADVPGDMVPDRFYTQAELIVYINNCRRKCEHLINGLTDETILARWVEDSGEMDYSLFEILIYNLRHVQHHAAQLNTLLRGAIDKAPGWVFREGEA
ncbi:MAG: DinB family protein [Chitinophagaceae bacterium]|nr:MAG: DinB family protein [Chitinophagaceae bacterium]